MSDDMYGGSTLVTYVLSVRTISGGIANEPLEPQLFDLLSCSNYDQ